MPISKFQFEEMQRRLAPKLKAGVPSDPGKSMGVERESKLHAAVLEFCAAQWPKWVPLFARPGIPSTLPAGAHDLTIFAQHPNCYLIELKARNEKQKRDQNIWAARLKALGWIVKVVRNWPEFLEVVKCKEV